MHSVASPITTPSAIPFSPQREPSTPTHLVAHWLKDANGKLYRIWVSEKVTP
ncbi:MAG: hypothetical protein VKJ86_01235 [Synechococcus sp.]|nr:hypothetical protein [Synechococcus sp.]